MCICCLNESAKGLVKGCGGTFTNIKSRICNTGPPPAINQYTIDYD